MEASQASIVFKYQNVKIKLLKTNLHIKFNKKCLENNLIPKYARIYINNTSPTARKTKEHAELFWVKSEIKYLYRKKLMLNNRCLLYTSRCV